MSKIEYPKQSEINRQIQTIIKDSGMFEDNLTHDGFTELKPIKRKNEKIIQLIKVASSLAAIVCLIVFINFMRKPMESSSTQPLKGYEAIKDDYQTNKQNTSEVNNNSKIQYVSIDRNVVYKNGTAPNIEFKVNDISYNNANFTNQFDVENCGKLECIYPVIKDSSIGYIEQYYQSVVEELEKRIQTEYLKGRVSGTNNQMTIKYEVNYTETTNENIITFLEKEQIIISNNGSEETNNNNMYAKTFNLNTEQPVELNDLFSEFDENVLQYIDNCIETYYSQAFDAQKEEGLESPNEEFNQEFNWYLTSQGVVFLINNMYYNNGVDAKSQNSYSGSVLINYSDFYKAGFKFNSTYINYLP